MPCSQGEQSMCTPAAGWCVPSLPWLWGELGCTCAVHSAARVNCVGMPSTGPHFCSSTAGPCISRSPRLWGKLRRRGPSSCVQSALTVNCAGVARPHWRAGASPPGPGKFFPTDPGCGSQNVEDHWGRVLCAYWLEGGKAREGSSHKTGIGAFLQRKMCC